MAIKHAFSSAVADGADATLVRPSNWNANHVIDDPGVPVAMVLGSNFVVPANYSFYVPEHFEVSSGFSLELSAGAVMEIG